MGTTNKRLKVMKKTSLIPANLLLVLFIVSTLPVVAQKAVCVYCGVELPYGTHKPGCPYYKKPATSSSGKSTRSQSDNTISILNAINFLLDDMLSEEPDADKVRDEIIAAEKKRIDDSIKEVNHNKMMSSFKKLDDGKSSGMKSLDEYTPGKFSKVHFNCKITSYTGAVEIRRNGKIIAYSKNIGDVELQAGDVIKTGIPGIVKMHYEFESGGKDIVLGANTEMKIEKNEDGNLVPDLQRGSFFAAGETVPENVQRYAKSLLYRLRKKFEIRTPTAVCGVRGTIFTVNQNDTTGCEFNVFDGSIIVAPVTGVDSIVVNKGEKVIVTPGGKISDLLPADLKILELWRAEISQIE